jgi:hypothetical protein
MPDPPGHNPPPRPNNPKQKHPNNQNNDQGRSPPLATATMNEDAAVTSPYSFSWDGSEEGGNTAADILAIKEIPAERGAKFGEFKLWKPPTDDEDLLRAIMDVFRYCHENEISWDTFVLYIDSGGVGNFHFVRPLLFAANMMGLFRRLKLHADSTAVEVEPQQTGEFLLAGVTLNRRLEALQLHSTSGGGRVTLGDYRALSSLLRTTTTLRQLTLDGITNFEEDLFCQGLQENKTLHGLTLSFVQCDVPDASIAHVVSYLHNHPMLQSLVLCSSGQFGTMSSQAIKELLSSSTCKLKSLALKGFEFFEFDTTDGKLLTEVILQGIQRSKSLKTILVADALDGDQLFTSFFSLLHYCSLINTLHLWEYDITEEDLDSVIKHKKRLGHPIVLGLGFSVMGTLTESLQKLLWAHPELRMEHGGFVDCNGSFLHLCEWNWYGRYLMDRPKFPLSMWPVVLEKANSKPNVIYEFLKGPAFVARQPYHR